MASKQRTTKRFPIYNLELIERRLMLSAVVDQATSFPSTWHANPIGITSLPVKSPTGQLIRPNAQGSATPVGIISPAQMVGAYALNQISFNGGVTGNGAGQTIAIVDAYDDPNALADLRAFDAAFNLPDPPSFQKLNQQGQPAPLPGVDPAPLGNTWELEESLDIEWAHVIAPQANIILVEADTPSDDLFTAVRAAARVPGVSVVSMSWSGSETASELNQDSTFLTPFNHTGVSFVAAAGDSGIYSRSNPTLVDPQYPATSPNVIAVGGTALFTTGNAYASETGWGFGTFSGVNGGGGGGTSNFEKKPDYQSFLDTLSATNRTYPDVAMESDPATGVAVLDSYDFGTQTPWTDFAVGGTSLATPMFSAVLAIVNQGRVVNGLSTMDGATQTLPRLYNLPNADYHDITTGDNGDPASTGYDLVTGRGSPFGERLVADMSSTYIGYHVFADVNVDGVQNLGETGISNVTIQLNSAGVDGIIGTVDDTTVRSTLSDTDGLYEFTNVPVGTFYIHMQPPAGYKVTPIGGGRISSGNNVLDRNGNSGLFTTTTTTQNPNINGGMYVETISIDDVTVSRPHSGLAAMVFTVTITPFNLTQISVPYTTVDGTATVANNDYQPASGTLVFPAGVTTETITVQAVGNLTIENDVTYDVVLTVPPDVFGGGSKTTGVGTILNTNFPAASVGGTPSVLRSDTVDQIVSFSVSLSAPAPFSVSVPYTTADNTAIDTLDYIGQTGTLVFPAHSVGPLTVQVTILPGTNRQLDKTFFVKVLGSTTATVGTPAQAAGTILTNAPPGVNADPAEVTESPTGIAYLPFNVDVEPSLTGVVTVDYTTSDGTAVAGKDYTPQSGTITFAPGRIQQTIYVPVFQQFITAQDKTVTFTLSNPKGNILLLSPVVTGTIHYLSLAALPFSAKTKATYTDALNQKVTVSMAGIGSGNVVFLGSTSNLTNAFEILLDGTNAGSRVFVKVAGRDGQTSFQNLVATGSVGTIDAGTTNILSSVSIAGGLSSLKLGYVAASAITIGGATSGQSVGLTFNRVLNSTITSAIPISFITAGAYLNTTGSPLNITAPRVGTIKVKGNFGGTIVTNSIQSLQVGGTIDTGSILATGSIGTVSATSIINSQFLAGVVGGAPAAASDFTNRKSLIGQVKVHGGLFADTIIAGWNVRAVSVGAVSGATSGVTANHVGAFKAGTGSTGVSVKDPVDQTSVAGFKVDLL